MNIIKSITRYPYELDKTGKTIYEFQLWIYKFFILSITILIIINDFNPYVGKIILINILYIYCGFIYITLTETKYRDIYHFFIMLNASTFIFLLLSKEVFKIIFNSL